MLNQNINDLNKMYPNIKEEFNNIKYGKILHIDNKKISDKLFKKNLPELKLINLKTRPGTESPDNKSIKFNKNLTIVQTNEKNKSIIPNKNNNNTLRNKRELPFPRINILKNRDIKDFNYFKKNFSIYSNNNSPSRWINNEIKDFKDNKYLFNKLSRIKNENNKDKDKDNSSIYNKKEQAKNNDDIIKERKDNSYNNKNILKNEIIKDENKKSKIPKIQKINFNQKLNIVKNKSSNILNKNKHVNGNSTMFSPFQGINKFSHNIQNKTILNNKIIKNKPFFSSPSSNELRENSDNSDILNNIIDILRTSSTTDWDGIVPIQQKINLTPQIYKNTYKNFKKSIKSKKEDINEKDYIKGFAYNSCVGNIRDYNEDSITVEKIYFNNNLNDYCYYFGIFDGHGGKGCSNYLKENLHKNIKEFSTIGIKIGIDITEERFKINEAIDEKGEIKDSSGSCGIILMVKNNKCIIANIGDSRLVIFKNNNLEFSTMDHKPDSIIEKARIELSGGKIYKTPDLFPLNSEKFEIPWRVTPGRLSVSRAFGDIQAKDEKFGGNKTVIIALPDITEINLDDNYSFIVLGCDGIFDVLKNEELLKCVDIVLKEKGMKDYIDDKDIHQLCGDFTDMIIKSALARYSLDNLSCIFIGLNLNNLFDVD